MLFNPLPRPSKTPTPNSPRTALIAAVLATTIAAVGLALGTAGRSDAGPRPEERPSHDQLHSAAKAEEGRFVVRVDGDDTKAAFEKRFPGVTVTTVVDDGDGGLPR
ncbi:hypothetical protein ACVNF4_29005 [Streptomyces sp. S6]